MGNVDMKFHVAIPYWESLHLNKLSVDTDSIQHQNSRSIHYQILHVYIFIQ